MLNYCIIRFAMYPLIILFLLNSWTILLKENLNVRVFCLIIILNVSFNVQKVFYFKITVLLSKYELFQFVVNLQIIWSFKKWLMAVRSFLTCYFYYKSPSFYDSLNSNYL